MAERKFYPNTKVENILDTMSAAYVPDTSKEVDTTQATYTPAWPFTAMMGEEPRNIYQDINTGVPAAGVIAASAALPFAAPGLFGVAAPTAGMGAKEILKRMIMGESVASATAGYATTDLDRIRGLFNAEDRKKYLEGMTASELSPWTTGWTGIVSPLDQIAAELTPVGKLGRAGRTRRLKKSRERNKQTKEQQRKLREFEELSRFLRGGGA